MTFWSYDYTNDEGVSSFLGCVPDIENVKQSEDNLLESDKVPETAVEENQKPIAVNQKNGTEFNIVDVTRNIPIDGSIDQWEDTERSDTDDTDTSTMESTTTKRHHAICTSKPLVVISLLLAGFLTLMISATVFRAQREDSPSLSLRPIESFEEADSSQSHPDAPEEEGIDINPFGLHLGGLIEGEICSGNDDCESGICRGATPPYKCQPKHGSCHLCSENNNCLSGLCVRRSGKSICASNTDGTMDIGCFCDINEDCTSQRCEGGTLMYTCRAPTEVISAAEMATGGNGLPAGGRCSNQADCSSHICVGFALGNDGECSTGREGSICGGAEDCVTERCIRGICEPKQTVGGTCMRNTDCASGLCFGFSNFNSGLCFDTSTDNICRGEGEACGSSGTGTCVGGFCRDFQFEEGEICLEDEDCLSGSCSWSHIHFAKLCDGS